MQPTNSSNSFAPGLGRRIAIAAATLALLVAAGMALGTGCGAKHAERTASAAGGSQTDAVPVSAQMPATGATPAAAAAPAVSPWVGHVVALGDSLPPDVAVTVEDTLVRRGEVVEITAQGSEDVSQVGLSDAVGRVQLFTREPVSNDWRVLYRVPLKSSKDRIALSVTALNDLNRWRRVWVFLRIRPDESPAAADSSR